MLRWSWGPRSKPPSGRGNLKERMRRSKRILIMHHQFIQLKAAAITLQNLGRMFSNTADIRRKSMHPRLWSSLSLSSSRPSSIFSNKTIPKPNPSPGIRLGPSTSMARLYNRLYRMTTIALHRIQKAMSQVGMHCHSMPCFNQIATVQNMMRNFNVTWNCSRSTVSPFDNSVCRQDLLTSGKKRCKASKSTVTTDKPSTADSIQLHINESQTEYAKAGDGHKLPWQAHVVDVSWASTHLQMKSEPQSRFR